MEEVGSEHLGYGKDPLGMRHVSENLVLKQLGEDGCPLGCAGRAESSSFTGEGDEKLEVTPRADDAGETGFQQAAIEVLVNGALVKASPETVSALEPLLVSPSNNEGAA